MKTMKIDEVEYVLKSEYDKLENKLKQRKPLDTIYRVGLTDSANVLGMGSVQIGTEYSVVRISIDYLDMILKSLKNILSKEQDIDIAIADNRPLVIGLRDKTLKEIGGFILAPIIVDAE